ncbi:hypothetical protein ACJ41O_015158 [Fusarium nematophilum]
MQQKQVSVLVRIELEIQSEALCRAFRKIAINSYEDTGLQSFPIKLRSPFSELFFYREEIRSLMEDESNSEEIRRGARVLHEFVLKNGLMASIVHDHKKYSKENHVVGDILWTIYPPNTLVVLNVGKLQECWICRNVSIKQSQIGYFWEVIGFRIGYGGFSPGLTRQTFRLPFVGCSSTLHKVLGKDLLSFASQTYANVGWKMEFSDYDTSLNPMLYANQLDGRMVVDYKSFLSERQEGTTELVDLRSKLKHPK